MDFFRVVNLGQLKTSTQSTSPEGLIPSDCDQIPADRIMDRYNCENQAFKRRFEPAPSGHGTAPPAPAYGNRPAPQDTPTAMPPVSSPMPTLPAAPTKMGYESENALSDTWLEYLDSQKRGDTDEMTDAFYRYRKAHEKNESEKPLREKMEKMAEEQERNVIEMATSPDLSWPWTLAERRSRELSKKMEATWPGWYRGYLDHKVYTLTGGQPELYRNLKEASATALGLALQLAPFLSYGRGLRPSIRPWVPTPGRAPARLPVTPSVSPVRPSVVTPSQPPVPTTFMEQWWQNRQKMGPTLGPSVPTSSSSKEVWRAYNERVTSAPTAPFTETRRPTPTPAVLPQMTVPQPTSMAPPPVAAGGGAPGPGNCPAGQFWNGSTCRGAVASMPGGIPTGGGGPAGAVSFGLGGYPVVNL